MEIGDGGALRAVAARQVARVVGVRPPDARAAGQSDGEIGPQDHGSRADPVAAAGPAGVARALEILRSDVERTLRLLGCPSIAALDRSYVEVPAAWSIHGTSRLAPTSPAH